MQQSNKCFHAQFLLIHVALKKTRQAYIAVCQVEFNGTITQTVAFQCFLFTVFTFGSWTECDTKNESLKEVESSSIKTEKYNSDGALPDKGPRFRRPEFDRHLCSNVKGDQFLRSDFQTGLLHLLGAAFSSWCLCKCFLTPVTPFKLCVIQALFCMMGSCCWFLCLRKSLSMSAHGRAEGHAFLALRLSMDLSAGQSYCTAEPYHQM